MSHAHIRFAIAYALLVALPLAGLLLVLRSGQSLTAPASVSGTWQIVRDSDQPSWFDCKASPAHTAKLSISQSGKYLQVTLQQNAAMSGRGTLDSSGLRASLTTRDANCGAQPSITMEAIFDSGVKPTLLTGTLVAGRCPACTSIPFRGVRQSLDKEEVH